MRVWTRSSPRRRSWTCRGSCRPVSPNWRRKSSRPTVLLHRSLPANASRGGGATRPRTVFAMAVAGLLLIGGVAFLGSVTSGTLYVYVRDAPAEWRQLNVVFSDIQVHRASTGNDSGWIHLPLSSPSIDFVALANLTRLLALDRAPAGKYTQLRLVVTSVEGILSDGTPVTLIVPSGEIKTTTA